MRLSQRALHFFLSVMVVPRHVIASVTVALMDAGSAAMMVRLRASEKSVTHGAFSTSINSTPTTTSENR